MNITKMNSIQVIPQLKGNSEVKTQHNLKKNDSISFEKNLKLSTTNIKKFLNFIFFHKSQPQKFKPNSVENALNNAINTIREQNTMNELINNPNSQLSKALRIAQEKSNQ